MLKSNINNGWGIEVQETKACKVQQTSEVGYSAFHKGA